MKPRLPIYVASTLLLLVGICILTSVSAIARDNKGRFVVVLDPGHGGDDSGALGKRSKEKTINLSVALKVGERINALCRDIEVLYTRKTDRFIGLQERAQYANRQNADLFVSIHANSNKARRARGTETFVLGLHRTAENLEVAKKENSVILIEDDYSTKYEGFNPESTESYIIFEFMQNKHLEKSTALASLVHQGLTKTGLVDRGVKQAGFLVLRQTSMPSILVELGFISNSNDEEYMISKKGQKEIADQIAKAIVQYKERMDQTSGHGSKSQSKEKKTTADTPESGIALQPVPGSSGHDQSLTPPEDKPLYCIQIHADRQLLNASHHAFKGYSNGLSYYREGGLYKYTLYATPDRTEAQRLQRELSKTFKDCFIISFINGVKQ